MIVLPGAVVLKCNLVKYIFLKKTFYKSKKKNKHRASPNIIGKLKVFVSWLSRWGFHQAHLQTYPRRKHTL